MMCEPTRTSAAGTSLSVPSSSMMRAVGGASSIRAATARRARPRLQASRARASAKKNVAGFVRAIEGALAKGSFMPLAQREVAKPDGGALLLATEDMDDIHGSPGVALRVCDTGGGIPADILSRVFEPFFTTKHRQGTGLGLSISQMLATRHGGTLSVASTGAGGTVLELWLPEAGSDQHVI